MKVPPNSSAVTSRLLFERKIPDVGHRHSATWSRGFCTAAEPAADDENIEQLSRLVLELGKF